MSRIGKAPVTIPSGVQIDIKDHVVTVKGPKGELTQTLDPVISTEIKDGELILDRANELKLTKSLHGLYRSLIHNMVVGVSEGYTIQQELIGVGFRAKTTGQLLELALGFAHPIVLQVPDEVTVSAETGKGKNPIITLQSHDKQLVGQVAARIRAMRKPEPYKGKGIRFVGEEVRRKAGKSAGK